MTPSEHDLEKLLRQAPSPNPPPGLRQEILRAAPAEHAPGEEPLAVGWLARWLNSWRFAAAAAALALATLGVVAVQQAELRQLRRQVEELRQQLETRPATPPVEGMSANAAAAPAPAATSSERTDLERLRAEAAKLQADGNRLGKLNAENAQLRGELAALVPQVLPEEFAALREAKARAQRINCVNNMKQLGLAVRIYANDHHDAFPKDVLAMTNELNTPKILVCPADTNRQPAASWSVYTPANFSYEYLAADGSDTDPQRVLFRCTAHRGNVGLCDGSVQQLTEPMQAQRLVTRDGKLYLESGSQPAPTGGGPR